LENNQLINDGTDRGWQPLNFVVSELVLGFIREPYAHRCEHDFHQEIKTAFLGLPGYPARLDWGFPICPIQKEYPEPERRPSKSQRSQFDIAGLPRLAGDCLPVRREDYLTGRIRPVFAIEVGLNCYVDHLLGDWEKLKYHGLKYGYVIHLAREEQSRQPAVERAVASLIPLEATTRTRIAYVHVLPHEVRLRLPGDPQIRVRSRPCAL
jgi:hypothetical protein